MERLEVLLERQHIVVTDETGFHFLRNGGGAEGNRLEIEVTAEYERHRVTATVRKTPFFNPPRKRSLP